MKDFRAFGVLVISLLLVVGVVACEKTGQAESTGKKTVKAVDDTDDIIHNTVDKVGEAMSDEKK